MTEHKSKTTEISSKSAIENKLAELTLEEKISLLAGQDFWSLGAIESVGIPSLVMSDGPTGLRSTNSDPATVFPVGTSLAATWNPEIVNSVAAAIGREAIAYGVHVLLAPGTNLQRTPLGGRNFEYHSEDPCLAGSIATAFINGVQSQGVGTSLKHFAANNQEHRRMDGSSDMDERTLREVYLPAFENTVSDANPWTIMSAYNKINGTFCSENDWLLNEILKDEWGYDGVVVSDWGAAKSTVGSANGGLDIEMPGPPKVFGQALIDAIERGDVDHETIDDHARRVLTLIQRCGLLDGGNDDKAEAELSSEKHRQIARNAAKESIVLLKNENNALPLRPGGHVAAIGCLADYPAIQGGGSSQVSPDRIVTPLEELKNRIGRDGTFVFERGVDQEQRPPIINPRLLSSASGKRGLDVRYFTSPNLDGDPCDEGVDWHFSKLGFGERAQTGDNAAFSAEWTGYLQARYSGIHEFEITHSNPEVELSVDGKSLVDAASPRETELLFMILPLNKREAQVELEAGERYPVTIRYRQPAEGAIRGFNIFNVAMREPRPSASDALEAAKDSDTAIVFVGPGTTAETEGQDRESLRLSDDQNTLVEEVAARNGKTIVVVNCGGAVEMPWADKVSAIVQCWLPGQEGGAAICDVLTGDHNPSGKLPITLPVRYEDNPTYLHYPGGSHVHYGEGLFVGYRHYDAAATAPLYPFGHGLSYTEFELSDLSVQSQAAALEEIPVSVSLKNSGALAGGQVVQVYVEHLDPVETMPIRQLRAFSKCFLEPGEVKSVELMLPSRALAWFDVDAGKWTVTAGRFQVHVGTSSRDLPLIAEIEVSK